MRECPRCELCYEDDTLTCPQDEASTKATLPGGKLLAARYLLEKRVGRGAMGQVYLARDQNLPTPGSRALSKPKPVPEPNNKT